MNLTAGRDFVPDVRRYVDPDGRPFDYVPVRHPGGEGLVVHFSAFFGKWGDAKPYRDQFQGYFHRLKMLGSSSAHNWLFLCDAYGAFDNGCYYLGPHGDLFVERAMRSIVEDELGALGIGPDRVVTMGSSMGATGALSLGLQLGVRGIVAIVPHIDLDVSATTQDRMEEVAWVCSGGEVTDPANHPVTRRVRTLLADPAIARFPRLFVQSCADDVGVHAEQVEPFAEAWAERGGEVVLDVRPSGGHTSAYATRPLLLDVAGRLVRGDPIDARRYQEDPVFAGRPEEPPLTHRIRRSLSLTRKRLLRR